MSRVFQGFFTQICGSVLFLLHADLGAREQSVVLVVIILNWTQQIFSSLLIRVLFGRSPMLLLHQELFAALTTSPYSSSARRCWLRTSACGRCTKDS
jgi:hypothetical protein